eukprot:2928243-Pyramimonas_sp.AAC.1
MYVGNRTATLTAHVDDAKCGNTLRPDKGRSIWSLTRAFYMNPKLAQKQMHLAGATALFKRLRRCLAPPARHPETTRAA